MKPKTVTEEKIHDFVLHFTEAIHSLTGRQTRHLGFLITLTSWTFIAFLLAVLRTFDGRKLSFCSDCNLVIQEDDLFDPGTNCPADFFFLIF